MIRIRGARTHNLRDVNLDIPKDKLVVFTGVSGSGKSSLAFKTLFAEGQRRYVETFSSYGRQMIGMMDKPDVDSIENLSPAISIEQASTSQNPRSVVGTMTEIYDYLRLAFGHAAVACCPRCRTPVPSMALDEIVSAILETAATHPTQKDISVAFPIGHGHGVVDGDLQSQMAKWRSHGFTKAIIDGELCRIDRSDHIATAKDISTVLVVVDRMATNRSEDPEMRMRLVEAVRTALSLENQCVVVVWPEFKQTYSSQHICPTHGPVDHPELSPQRFSFNSPEGACETCNGIGVLESFTEKTLFPSPDCSIQDALDHLWDNVGEGKEDFGIVLREVLEHASASAKIARDFSSVDLPLSKLTPELRRIILYGEPQVHLPRLSQKPKGLLFANWGAQRFPRVWPGLIPLMEDAWKNGLIRKKRKWWLHISRLRGISPCPSCSGIRLKPSSRVALLGSYRWEDIATRENCIAALSKIEHLESQLSTAQISICRLPLMEARRRIQCLVDLGLGYLSLDRITGTLSGGESRRIRLASRIGSPLTGVLYVMDEPSIGLHPRDTGRLLQALETIRNMRNTVVVVEHDEDTIRRADHIVDFGPRAGEHGGRVVAQGTLQDIVLNPNSLTGAYLSGQRKISTPEVRRRGNGRKLVIRGVYANNIRGLDVQFELGTLTTICGPSGSGKSTLLCHVLGPALSQKTSITKENEVEYHSNAEEPDDLDRSLFDPLVSVDQIDGAEEVSRVIIINQKSIGRMGRSNPVTYLGAFDAIRATFSCLPDAKAKGMTPGHFSFNKPGGRCEACQGQGARVVSMRFLPDVVVECPTCRGRRYDSDTLSVLYRGLSIADVLDLSVEQACEVFQGVGKALSGLEALNSVGLGYIRLGQPLPSLSGGEAQRVKLASELTRRSAGKSLFLIDEPTTGLSFHDVHQLVNIFHALVDKGNTVVVIEHNMDVIRNSDRVIDLGPEGGNGGGRIMAYGTPEQVASAGVSPTAPFLRKALNL